MNEARSCRGIKEDFCEGARLDVGVCDGDDRGCVCVSLSGKEEDEINHDIRIPINYEPISIIWVVV